MKPLISIVLPIYNAEYTIKETINSILLQDYDNFEILAIIDGATDKSREIVESKGDSRIKVIDNVVNKGLIYSLNIGFNVAKGKYIARMDADDIMEPTRLSKQLKFMESHPDIDICGCFITIFNKSGVIGTQLFGKSHNEILAEMLFNSPIAHPTFFIRAAAFKSFTYDYECKYCEDYDILSRFLLANHKAENIPEFLLRYRISDMSQTYKGELISDYRYKSITRIQDNILKKGLGLELKDYSKKLHYKLSLTDRIKELSISEFPIQSIKKHFGNLINANKQISYCSDIALKSTIGKVWLKVLRFQVIKNLRLYPFIISKYTLYGMLHLLNRA